MSQWQRLMWAGLILFWLGTPLASAQSPAPQLVTPPPIKPDLRLDADHQKELDRLKAEDPARYRLLLAGIQVMLARLGYASRPFDGTLDARFRDALRAYQQQASLQATGLPDRRTLDRLVDDNRDLDSLPVQLPAENGKLSPLFWDDLVQAKGTWGIQGSEHAHPLHVVEITCWRSQHLCVEAMARLEKAHFGGRPFLNVYTERYEVERWDSHEIVTKPLDFACVRYVIRLKRLDQSVVASRTPLATTGSCADLEQHELRLVLLDSFKQWWTLEERYRRAQERVLGLPRR